MDKKRTISQSEKEYLLSLKPDDITLELLQKLFASKYNVKQKKIIPGMFNTYDEISLKKGEYFNTTDILTNCGLLIFNKFLVEPDFKDLLGYCNNPVTKKEMGKIQSKLDDALMEDEIKSDVYIKFMERMTWLAFTFNTEVCTSLTMKSMKELPEVKKKKEQLKVKYKSELESDDNNVATITAVKIEKELVDVAKDILKDDPAYDLYESGARGAFGVAYKNAQIMKGPVYNSSKHKFDIMYEPIASGIRKENVPTLANGVIDSQYQKSISTGECGYETKKLNAVFQNAVLDKRGSDCHSKGYNTVTITPDNYSFYSYNFIIEGSKLVRLDSKTKSKYMGRTVKIRSNAYCTNKNKTCNMCAGDKFYLLGNENYGLTTGKAANTLLNKRMKAIHASTVSYYTIDLENDLL